MTASLLREYIQIVEAHGIAGLPDDVAVNDLALHKTLARGGHRPVATPSTISRMASAPYYDLTLHPRGKATAFKRRPYDPNDERVDYHDPELSDLDVMNADDPIIARAYARLKPHLSSQIAPLPDDDVMYRGMSSEEYVNFQKTGKIQSRGDYNIGSSQEGLTYWTTRVESATFYANGFAPMEHKATFLHPAYVVAAKNPGPGFIRHVKGTNEHELGVTRPITADEVLALWRGRAYSYNPGSIELRPHGDNEYRVGSSTVPSSELAWERIA